MDEFALIQKFFQPLQDGSSASASNDFLIKIGDDAAVWKGQGNLAFSIDTLVEGVHFTSDIRPEDLGYRVLAVNLSDMAAMAAQPLFFTLAITLPRSDPEWLRRFASGLGELASQHNVLLVGGDTTCGPLTISVQIHGSCPNPIKRSAALVSDDVYVTGYLGDAAAGLKLWLETKSEGVTDTHQYLLQRFHRPTARVELATVLSPYLNSMLDVSDGLVSDLGHIAKTSDVDINIDTRLIPISHQLSSYFSEEEALKAALTGGDDYELAFTASSSYRSAIEEISNKFSIPVTRVGVVLEKGDPDCSGSVLLSPESFQLDKGGYNHF